MDVTKPYEFTGVGAMDVTKPYEFIGLGAMVTTASKYVVSILCLLSTRLSYLTVNKFRTVVETRRNRARIVRNRCVPVCGHRAVYFGLGFVPL